MGVTVRTIERSFEPPAMTRLSTASTAPATVWGPVKPAYYVIDARGTGGARAANRLAAAGLGPAWIGTTVDTGGFSYRPGSIVVPYSKEAAWLMPRIAAELGLRVDGVKGKAPAATPIARARVALYKPWVENIDESWTRWLLEQYEFRYTTVTDADLRAGNLRERFDALIVPSAPAARLVGGHPRTAVPAEYAGGLGAIKAFVEAGGTLICLDQAASLAIEAFQLPVRDVTSDAGDRFYCPGSLVRLDIDESSPLGYGMLTSTAAFFAYSAAFEETPGAATPVQTAARYASRDVLLSGLLDGEDVIAGRSAVVRAKMGAGEAVLFGFPVQHRGQSLATFRLLFNAILQTPLGEPSKRPRTRR